MRLLPYFLQDDSYKAGRCWRGVRDAPSIKIDPAELSERS